MIASKPGQLNRQCIGLVLRSNDRSGVQILAREVIINVEKKGIINTNLNKSRVSDPGILFWQYRTQKVVKKMYSTRCRFHKLIYILRPAICALRTTFEKLFTGAKVWRKVQKISVGRKTFNEIEPCTFFVAIVPLLVTLCVVVQLTALHTDLQFGTFLTIFINKIDWIFSFVVSLFCLCVFLFKTCVLSLSLFLYSC